MTATIRFVPFTEPDFRAWLIEAIPSFALTNVEDGRWTLAESIDKSKEAHAALLPQGLRTPGQFFVQLHDADTGEHVGMRYDATEVMAGLTEVLCYGTAVVVEASRDA